MEDTNKRNIDLLTRIVHEYIVSGHPIGSLFLAEKYHLPMSSATIRNAMALLEEEGYMYQPHPSAGRVPTIAGYRVYIEMAKPAKVSKRHHDVLSDAWGEGVREEEQRIKKLAKGLSSLCDDAVFVGFEGGSGVNVTGLSNLCKKVEFSDREIAMKLSEVIDSLDENMRTLFDQIGAEPQVFIGGDGFSEVCSIVALQFQTSIGRGIIGIIGPLRMNYPRNISLLKTTQEIIED